MTRALLATSTLFVLCIALGGCGGSDSSADRAAHDKGPRQVPANPEPAPGSNLTLGSKSGDSSGGRGGAGATSGNTGGSTGH